MRPMFAVSESDNQIYEHARRIAQKLTTSGQSFVPQTSITFVSKASIETGTVASYNLRKRVEAVKNCRKIGKKDMKFNDNMPRMKVDPETYVNSSFHPCRGYDTDKPTFL